jgi:hypothetical protein
LQHPTADSSDHLAAPQTNTGDHRGTMEKVTFADVADTFRFLGL